MFGLGKKDKIQKLKFKILSKDMLQEYKVKLSKEQASSNLKGYRKGKAPLEVIEQYYGEQPVSYTHLTLPTTLVV